MPRAPSLLPPNREAKPFQISQVLDMVREFGLDGAWVADLPDLQSCSAFGGTPAQALAEIEQAIEAWLAVAREDGPPIPEPCYRAPTRAAGVESVQASRSCLVLTLTDIAGLEANVSDGWIPALQV
jgi:predicted RNase H-like HicB family nuclease